MARLGDISDDTRVIDLTVADLLDLLTVRLRTWSGTKRAGHVRPEGCLIRGRRPSSAYSLAKGCRRSHPAGTAEYRAWRRKEQSPETKWRGAFRPGLIAIQKWRRLAVKPKGERRRYSTHRHRGYLGQVAVADVRRRTG